MIKCIKHNLYLKDIDINISKGRLCITKHFGCLNCDYTMKRNDYKHVNLNHLTCEDEQMVTTIVPDTEWINGNML